MPAQVDVVLNQIVVFAILMAIGFVAVKVNIFTRDALNAISKLVVMILIPALIFSIVAGSGVTLHDFLVSGPFAFGVALCYAMLILSAAAMGRLLKREGKSGNIFVAMATFGNMGFMGIPLLLGIFTDPAVQVCISVYMVIDTTLLFTYGVYLCSRHQHAANTFRNVANPTTAALLIGLVVMAFNLPVPGLVMNTIAGIGGTSRYLTLIYIGGVLAFVSVRNPAKKPEILALTAVKMLVLPVVAFVLLGFFLTPVPRLALTFIVGLPAMTTIAMIATQYQSDVDYATEVIFVTTLASLVTIPLLSFLTTVL